MSAIECSYARPYVALLSGNERFSLTNRKETVLVPQSTQSLWVGGFVMTFKFAVGDRVTQAFSNHVEGTVIAVLKDRAGEYRYVVEMFGHRTIQIASEGSLVAAP